VQSQPLSPPLKPTATGNKSIHYIFSISDLLIIFIIISLYRQFPARAPLEGTPEFETIHHFVNLHEGGLNRSASLQGCYQIAALFMTLAIAIASGVVTGFILRMPIIGRVPRQHLFDDELSWEIPESGELEHSSHKSTGSNEPMFHHTQHTAKFTPGSADSRL